MDSLMKYMKVVDNSFVFVGKKAQVRISRRLENYGLLKEDNQLYTLAIFEVLVDDKHKFGFRLPAVVIMQPSSTWKETVDDVDYLVAEFQTGDKFFVNREVLKQSHIAYSLFVEYLSLGYLPEFFTYESLATLFTSIQNVCGINLRVSHTEFEMIFAQQVRDSKDPKIKYRHTDRKKPFKFVKLGSVTYGPDSTTAKIIGSYMLDGVNAAINSPVEQRSDIEDLLRT